MSRLATLAPLALLSTACAVRTPATALDEMSATSPALQSLELPSQREAIAAWRLPVESPWSRYEKVTLLTYLADMPVSATMPEVTGLEVVSHARLAATRVAGAGLPPDTMWVVDLRGAASVAFGATLSQEAGPIAPVMTFNNWPAENEVVPAEQTLAALIAMQPKALGPFAGSAPPVFLLDAFRLALREEVPDPEAIDNRYVLLPFDFPDAATLRAHGIRRVIYVVEDRAQSSTEEDDFHDIALGYRDAGVTLALADLAELASLEAATNESAAALAARWDAVIDGWDLPVRERTTVLDDPLFYARARGGFGGVRAAPYGAGRTFGGAPWSGGSQGGRAFSGASPHVAGRGGG